MRPDTDPLELLLSDERAAILDGRYDALPGLQTRKEQLLHDLAARGPSPLAIGRIDRALRRNQSLLSAAIDGTRDGLDRHRAILSARDGFRAYGREGEATTVGGPRPTIERKA